VTLSTLYLRHIGHRILDHEGRVEGIETNGPAAGQRVEPAEYRISIKEQHETRDEQDSPQPVIDEEPVSPAAAVFSSTASSGKAFCQWCKCCNALVEAEAHTGWQRQGL